jgi:hypothetical protein
MSSRVILYQVSFDSLRVPSATESFRILATRGGYLLERLLQTYEGKRIELQNLGFYTSLEATRLLCIEGAYAYSVGEALKACNESPASPRTPSRSFKKMTIQELSASLTKLAEYPVNVSPDGGLHFTIPDIYVDATGSVQEVSTVRYTPEGYVTLHKGNATLSVEEFYLEVLREGAA